MLRFICSKETGAASNETKQQWEQGADNRCQIFARNKPDKRPCKTIGDRYPNRDAFTAHIVPVSTSEFLAWPLFVDLVERLPAYAAVP